MFANRKRADRSGKSLLYVGVISVAAFRPARLLLLNAAFRARGSESLLEVFPRLASIDSMPPGLVSFK